MYIVFILLAVLLWGTDAAITKRFLLNALDPISMVSLRLTIAGVATLPFIIKELGRLRALTRSQWLRLMVLIVLGAAVMNVLFYQGLERTPAFIALILARLEPVFVILISAVFLRQRTKLTTLLLTLATIAAGALVSLGGTQGEHLQITHLWGLGLILLASLCSATSTILAKDLLKLISPLMLNGLRTLLGGLILFAAIARPLVTETLPALPASDIALIVFMGVLYSAVGFWLYYKGLSRIAPLVVSQMQLLRIVSGLIASFVLLGEVPGALQWVGALALMALLYVLTRPNAEDNKAVAAVAAD